MYSERGGYRKRYTEKGVDIERDKRIKKMDKEIY